MTICPNCQMENRAGAKFCKKCGSDLPQARYATQPLSDYATVKLPAAGAQAGGATTVVLPAGNGKEAPVESGRRTNTRPLNARGPFLQRATGAVFGPGFVLDRLVFSDETELRYLVTQPPGMERRFRACPNPACGAIYAPKGSDPEQFCIDCGSPMNAPASPAPGEPASATDVIQLMLVERLTPFPAQWACLAAKELSHSAVRAPAAVFDERVGGEPRYCLVMPYIAPLPGRPEPSQALATGVSLARGLDYLHENGVWFGGQIDESSLGISGNRLVWANFPSCQAEGEASPHPEDVRGLAALLYRWQTGRSQYAPDPNLAPAVNAVYERALAGSFTSAGELAEAIDRSLHEATTPMAVDLRFGRRTHVGMERTLNEDSLATVDFGRIQQSRSQPLGLYVVADGMGGHAAGEIASGTIVNTLVQKAAAELLSAPSQPGSGPDRAQWAREAVEAANRAVFEMRKSAGTDMGSTLVMALLDGPAATIAHVGDSRAYLIHAQGIQQITTDHSLVERLIATGQITRAEARYHPQRNVIYRTIGDKLRVEVDIDTRSLAVGDRILLCSDGLSGMVDDQAILKIVTEASSPQAACDALIAAANAAGGEDNISAILVEVARA